MRNPARIAGPALVAALLLLAAPRTSASDHDDTHELKEIPRHDARISDVFAFTRGDRLVLILCTNPAIPVGTTAYEFPSDLALRVHVDNHSSVSYEDEEMNRLYGGRVLNPAEIEADVEFEVTFERGAPRLKTRGLRGGAHKDVQMFVGLRDDPFIRGPRIGRNVAAIVLELPLADALGKEPTLLVWASSKVPEVHGAYADIGGRAIRSQMEEGLDLNTMGPAAHERRLGVPPDVIIFDTSRPARFPNGRDLADDVVDMVGDTRLLANDAPFPSENDVPFLPSFPYLAPPQAP